MMRPRSSRRPRVVTLHAALLPTSLLLTSLFCTTAFGCASSSRSEPAPVQTSKSAETPDYQGKSQINQPQGATPAAVGPTNRVRAPALVRANLGVRFHRAELRVVSRTLRLPGRFELLPTATRTNHARLAGGVEFVVREQQRVEAGQLLATITPPALHERQLALHGAAHRIRRARSRIAGLTAALDAAKQQRRLLRQRLRRLGQAAVRRVALEARQLQLQAEVRSVSIQLSAARAEVVQARHHRRVQLRSFASVTGLSVAKLLQRATSTAKTTQTVSGPRGDHAEPSAKAAHNTKSPLWDRIDRLELRAKEAGIVTRIAANPGAWLRRGDAVVEVTDPKKLRFVATALQGDVIRLRAGAQAHVVAATIAPAARSGEAEGRRRPALGKVVMAIALHTAARTLPVHIRLSTVPAWARAGLVGFAEVVVAGGGGAEIAIPRAAVVRDGLLDVFFRRDPADADLVIRVDADLGADDGRWVAVFSGVNVGDEVVVQGAYELQLASAKRPKIKGHFHADGSFHADPASPASPAAPEKP